MADIDAVILAAGLSRRMGRDKLLLPLGGTSVLNSFLSRFPVTLFARTVVVTASTEVARISGNFPVHICHNDTPESGQARSIRLGLGATSPENAILFSVADQPLLKAETVAQLVALWGRQPDAIIQPRVGTRPANPVIFPADLRLELAGLTGDSGGREIIRRHRQRVRWLELKASDQFFDIDTPEQYQELMARWQTHH